MEPSKNGRQGLLGSRPARVGILIASLQPGGAERAALGLLEGFHAAGVETYLLTLDGNQAMVPTADGATGELLAQRIIRLSAADIGRGTISKTLSGPLQWLKLRRTVRRLELDVVLSIMERANIMNLLGAGSRRRIVSIRSFPSMLLQSKTPLKRFLVVNLYRALLRRADRVVFVSREAAADFERLFPAIVGRGSVIYNACNIDRLHQLAAEPIPEPFEHIFDRPVVIAAGRLNAEKGHWCLVRAFRELARRNDDARLVVIGDGPLRDDLVRLRDELGLANRVFFPGFQSNPLSWVARSRVFVLPSSWEGFPNSLLEAMALHVPVVSSDCRSGPRELMAPESDPEQKTNGIDETPAGYLVPPPNGVRHPAAEGPTREELFFAEAIEKAMQRAAADGVSKHAARERLTGFTREAIIPRWLDVIREP